MTDAELEIIAVLERSRGAPLTAEEIWLSLEQARAVGDLPQVGGVGSGYRVEL